jgi:hypothetical protein
MPKPTTPEPTLLRGSLITLRRRCGKLNCRCAGKNGTPHESPALSCAINGKSHIITLTEQELPAVREALRSYHDEQLRLEAACVAGIAWLRGQVDARRARRKA